MTGDGGSTTTLPEDATVEEYCEVRAAKEPVLRWKP
jgi:hypothetical protein